MSKFNRPEGRGVIDIRCARENNNTDETGCGWNGMTDTITQYGATTWKVEACPDCASEYLEAAE
jgi:hypothetical protein